MADTVARTASGAPSRANRLLFGGVAVLCAGVSAALVARAAVLLHTPEAAWVAPLPAEPAAVARAPRPVLDTGFDPFHREAAPAAVTPSLGEDAPETTLDLRLTALRANRAAPSATIKPPSGPERAFGLGEEIVAGVVLESVRPDFAVISRSGQLERLSLRENRVLARPEPVPTRAPAAPRNAALRSPAARPGPPPPSSATPARPVRKDPRPLGAQSAGDLLQHVQTSLAMVDGRPGGIRISGRDGFDLGEFGLRDGDIITAVDGQALNSPSGIQGLATTLQQNNSVSVTVRRGDSTITQRVGTP